MAFVKPLDETLLHKIFKKFDTLITIEDGTVNGGFGSAILAFSQTNNYINKKIRVLGIPDTFIQHGSVNELYSQLGLDEKSLYKTILNLINL